MARYVQHAAVLTSTSSFGEPMGVNSPTVRSMMLIFMISGLNAQTTLAFSSPIAARDAVTLELSLNSSSGVTPAAIQWTLQYPPAAFRSIIVEDGPILASSGKTIVCAGDATAYTCLVVGYNAEMIPDGVVARITVALAGSADTATITVSDSLGVSAGGDPIPIIATSVNVLVGQPRRRLPHCPAGDCR
jgi:hypothetical protein